MEEINCYSLLKKFSRNILYTIFDFLCTETVFLSVALINKLFYNKTHEYILVSHTLELADINYPYIPVFPRVVNLTIHFKSHKKVINISLHHTLENLKFYGCPSQGVTFEQHSSHLISFKFPITTIYNNPYNWQINKNINEIHNLFLPSYKNLTLKILKSDTFNKDFFLQNSECNQLEEITLPYSVDFSEEFASQIINQKQLKKLMFLDASSFINKEQKFNGYYQISEFKQLVEIRINPIVLSWNNIFINSINALPNLKSVKFNKCLTHSTLENLSFFLGCTKGRNFTKFRSAIILPKYSFDYYSVYISYIFKNFPKLESLKLLIKDIRDSDINSLAELVINECKTHETLYKFNGIPIKILEFGGIASIKLYEDLFLSSIPYSKEISVCLTSKLLYHYQYKLNDLYELRIKPIGFGVINIYLPKLLKKINKQGCFSDIKMYFKYPLFSFLTILTIISAKPEFTQLRLQTACQNSHFTEVLKRCRCLNSYYGPYNESLDAALGFLPNINYLNIYSPHIPLELSKITLPNLESLTIKNSSITCKSHTISFNSSFPIQMIEFINVKIGSTEIENISKLLSTFYGLKSLKLDINVINEADCRLFLLNLHPLQYLEVFHLTFNGMQSNLEIQSRMLDLALEILKHFMKIKDFLFYIKSGSRFSERYMVFIEKYLKINKTLEILYETEIKNFNKEYFKARFLE